MPIISSTKTVEKDIEEILGPEYLKNLPSKDYIIDSGDKLKIVVSREYEELTTIESVDGEGTIYLPKLNRVYVRNLTINELNRLLNKAFKEYIKYPSVEVQVLEYRPIKVFVDGEVLNPGIQSLKGSFVLQNNINNNIANNNLFNEQNLSESFENNQSYYFPTVFDAIRESGGITLYSDLSKVKVIRKNSISNGGGEITTTLNFEKVLIGEDYSQNIRIYDSDIIKVYKKDKENSFLLRKAILSKLNPRFLNVMVTGRVNLPGKILVAKESTLSDAIDMAGGAKFLKGPVTFIRFNNDGTIDKRKFAYRKNKKRGSYRNPNLKDGDLIFVGRNAFNAFNEITNEITAPFIGLFSTYGLIKAISD